MNTAETAGAGFEASGPRSPDSEDRAAGVQPVAMLGPLSAVAPGHTPIKISSRSVPVDVPKRPRMQSYRPGDAIYGALDLGTNNCRLLVARPSRRGFFVIDAFSRIIRLGEGVSHSGMLSEDAIARTIDALKVCSLKMSRRGVTRSRLVATEACRIAKNGAEFIARVKRETGLSLEIIGRETEARLAVSGCASLIDKNSEYALVFDIGGGSSEFVWLNLRNGRRFKRISIEDRLRIQDCIEAWTSLPFGVVTLAERFGGIHDADSQFEEMVSFVESQLQPFDETSAIAAKIARSEAHMLGTSGTVTTIAGVYLELPEYQRAKIDGCWLSTENIRKVSSKIVAMSWKERAAQPCIGTERADLIVAGCAIMEAMLRTWPVKCLRVADRGLREGILATLIAEDVLRQRSLGPRNGTARPRSGTLSPAHDQPRPDPGAIS